MLFRKQIEELNMTAPELRTHLVRELYVVSAVTEIASLRAEVSGPQNG